MPSLSIFILPFSLSRLFTFLTCFFFFFPIPLFSFSLATPHLLPSGFIFLNPPPLFQLLLIKSRLKNFNCNPLQPSFFSYRPFDFPPRLLSYIYSRQRIPGLEIPSEVRLSFSYFLIFYRFLLGSGCV